MSHSIIIIYTLYTHILRVLKVGFKTNRARCIEHNKYKDRFEKDINTIILVEENVSQLRIIF